MVRSKPVSGCSLVGCILALGCAQSGHEAYHLSGKVTFNSQPLPRGKIFFLPDTTKGNSGQGGFAEIKDGVYDTRNKGSATAGGPLIVRVDGFDGNTTSSNLVGNPLFLSYEVRVEVPRDSATRDFDVPAAAAKNLPKLVDPP